MMFVNLFRECIMPDVCRTFHFSKGVHINEVMQNRYFNTHSFNRMNKFHELQTKRYVTNTNNWQSTCICDVKNLDFLYLL